MYEPRDGDKGEQEDDRRSSYRPNYVDLDTRAVCLAGSALLICYAIASIVSDDFFIWLPGRRHTAYIHLHGVSVWLACLAVFAACLSMLSIVVDHHDTRDNELKYQKFAKVSLKVAFATLCFAVLADATYFHEGTFKSERSFPFPLK